MKRLRPAEVVEPREHAHQSVVRRLERDVVELAAAQVREHPLPAADLESCAAQQQRVQPRDRLVARRPLAAKARRATPGNPDRGRPTGSALPPAVIGASASTCSETVDAARSSHRASSGARIRTARSGGQPRSVSSINAWRSKRWSRADLRGERRRKAAGAELAATPADHVDADAGVEVGLSHVSPRSGSAPAAIDASASSLRPCSGSRRSRPCCVGAVLADARQRRRVRVDRDSRLAGVVGDGVDVAAGAACGTVPARHPDRLRVACRARGCPRRARPGRT